MHFNKFAVNDLLIVEYNCPLEEEKAGLWSQYDYIIHVLNGRKKWKTGDNEEWLMDKGQTLNIKKGAAIVEQFFDEGFCRLGFFISDDIIRAAVKESGGQQFLAFNTFALIAKKPGRAHGFIYTS